MKVSLTPNIPKTSTAPENNPPVTPEDDSLDKYFLDGDTGDEEVETDPFAEHILFYGTGPGISKGDFVEPNVPKVADIIGELSDAGQIEMTDRAEFYDLLERKYIELKSNIEKSIKTLEESLKETAIGKKIPDPVAKIYRQIIADRQEKIKEIDTQIENLGPLRASVQDIFTQEKANLTAYGKEYYKWQIAFKEGKEYNGEKATYSNKPSPNDYQLDLNGDNMIGDPKADKFAIASKEVAIEGNEKVTIFDVVNVDEQRAVSFNELGKVTGLTSCKDTNYNWVISHQNLKLIPKEEWGDGYGQTTGPDVLLELESEDTNCIGNGNLDLPIDITIPEYIRVDDKTGKAIGIAENAGKIVQDKADAGDWTLRRVVKVKVDKARAIGATGYDHVIKFYGEGEDGEINYTPLLTIRIRAKTGSSKAASDYAIGFNAGFEGDEFKNTSGMINIDAKNAAAKAQYNLSAEKWRKIEEQYGIVNPEGGAVYENALSQLRDGSWGVVSYGFGNVCLDGTNGNDLVLLEDSLEEYRNFVPESVADETMPPLATSALNGRGGFNAVFQKSGNFCGNQIGLYWGGKDADYTLINVIRDASVYINSLTENGHVEIGNKYDDNTNNSFGKKNDDFYGVNASDYVFAAWYEPEVYAKYADDKNIPARPSDRKALEAFEADAFADLEQTSCSDISAKTTTQIQEQLKALMNLKMDDDDESLFDYSGEGVGGEQFNNMKTEMETFFAGWNSWTGGFTGTEELPLFDDMVDDSE